VGKVALPSERRGEDETREINEITQEAGYRQESEEERL
jgi:hypothetical protein